jgi:hypothetical protein
MRRIDSFGLSRRRWIIASCGLAGCRSGSDLYGQAAISDSLHPSLQDRLAPFDYSRASFYEDRSEFVIHWGQVVPGGDNRRLNTFTVGSGAKIKERKQTRLLAYAPSIGSVFSTALSRFDGLQPRSRAQPEWAGVLGDRELGEWPAYSLNGPSSPGPPSALVLVSVLRYRDILIPGILIYDHLGRLRSRTYGFAPPPGSKQVTVKNEPDWLGNKLREFDREFGFSLPVVFISYYPLPSPKEQEFFGAPAMLSQPIDKVFPGTFKPTGPLPLERQYLFLLFDRANWAKEMGQNGDRIEERWLSYPVMPEDQVLRRHEPDLLFVD